MSTVSQFIALVSTKGSTVRFRRSGDIWLPCPCQTPEGFRDPRFHLSLGNYGPYNGVIVPAGGAIQAGHSLSYMAVAFNVEGAAASPGISVGTFATVVPSQIEFDLKFPTRGKVANWKVYRREDLVGNYKLIGTYGTGVMHFIDALPVAGGTTAYVAPALCNERGEIPQAPLDFTVKAFVQPIQSTRATRLNNEILTQMYGEVQADDHLGIFPCDWGSNSLDFRNWSQSGDEFVEYDGQRFLVVNSNKIPDPDDGNPNHHWEVGLRLITDTPITA